MQGDPRRAALRGQVDRGHNTELTDMNMNRLIPPKDCDDLAYWLSCVVWDAIRDAQDAGMTENETAILLDVVARSCARRAGREPLRYIGTRSSDPPDLHERLLDAAMTARGELLPLVETRCVGFGEDDCAGWPRWVSANPDWVSNLAFKLEHDDDESVDYYHREWQWKAFDEDVRDEPSCQPWEMFPERFADPSTWCGAEVL
jgi:hypothetical protein